MLKLVDVNKNDVRLFGSIAIEIASKCNRTCYFCPNGCNTQEDLFMNIENIKKCLLELSELKYKGRIEWYIYNEPTRDPRLLEIVKLAKELVPRACQMINTNGDYFKSSNDIKKLYDAGINQIQINVYSNKDGSSDIIKFNKGVEIAKKRETVLNGFLDECNIDKSLSLYQNIGSKKKAGLVVKKYGIGKTIKDSEVQGSNGFTNRSGNVEGFRGGLVEPIKKHCTRPFRFLNINYKGDGILCCNDYHGETKFGNITDKSLIEIWNDVSFNIYRLKMQNKDRACFLCDKCDFNGGYYPHLIDNVTFGEQEDKSLLKADLSTIEKIRNYEI